MSLQPPPEDAGKLDFTDKKVQLELVSAVLQDLDKHRLAGGPDDIFVSEKGLQLRMLPINQFIIKQVMQDFQNAVPQPPMEMVRGQRTPNKDDQGYKDALQKFEFDRGIAAMGIYCGYGTEPVEIPAALDKPEDTRWASRLKGIGIEVNDDLDSSDRYFAWLRYYALGEIEIARLCAGVMKLNGVVLEVEAQVAEETFRDEEARGETDGRVSEEPSGDGNQSSGLDNPSERISDSQ